MPLPTFEIQAAMRAKRSLNFPRVHPLHGHVEKWRHARAHHLALCTSTPVGTEEPAEISEHASVRRMVPRLPDPESHEDRRAFIGSGFSAARSGTTARCLR